MNNTLIFTHEDIAKQALAGKLMEESEKLFGYMLPPHWLSEDLYDREIRNYGKVRYINVIGIERIRKYDDPFHVVYWADLWRREGLKGSELSEQCFSEALWRLKGINARMWNWHRAKVLNGLSLTKLDRLKAIKEFQLRTIYALPKVKTIKED